MKKLLLAAVLGLMALTACGPRNGAHTLHILTTDDVHGAWFDSLYVTKGRVKSLMAVQGYVDSVRRAVGKDNVILIDAGDCLQGDNAAYYYNYVNTEGEHPFVRMVDYMGYDAIVVGNHDIETGHPVYDKVRAQLERRVIPILAGNAIRTDNSEPYFQEYAVFKRARMKVLVLGYTNANMKAWLQEELWSGMTFESLLPLVQERVDAIVAKENPQVVIVAIHSGTGDGKGTQLESQGLDLFRSLRGVDAVVCSHDHRQLTMQNNSIILLNAGNKARYIGHGTITADIRGGKVRSKQLSAELINVMYEKTDPEMSAAFHKEFCEVRDFTLRKVGELRCDMWTRDAYRGMSNYINFVHTVQLDVPEAQISFAAPLTYNGRIRPGDLIYNDLFTIYPFENQMFVIRMTGDEIRRFLEYSYGRWIQTYDGRHVFRISNQSDSRTGARNWSFNGRTYNFDSAAGLVYTVDITKPQGSRIQIKSLADGSAFDPKGWYNVALTSYRASGGGETMPKGAGITSDELDGRVVARYPEIRELIYDYIVKHGVIDEALINNASLLGEWHFIPEKLAHDAIEADMRLVFGR